MGVARVRLVCCSIPPLLGTVRMVLTNIYFSFLYFASNHRTLRRSCSSLFERLLRALYVDGVLRCLSHWDRWRRLETGYRAGHCAYRRSICPVLWPRAGNLGFRQQIRPYSRTVAVSPARRFAVKQLQFSHLYLRSLFMAIQTVNCLRCPPHLEVLIFFPVCRQHTLRCHTPGSIFLDCPAPTAAGNPRDSGYRYCLSTKFQIGSCSSGCRRS